MNLYIDKHFFSNTLYTDLDQDISANSEELKKATKNQFKGRIFEGAGITCYNEYNIIGFFKEKLGLAFKHTLEIDGNSKVIYIDAKNYAEWKVAEINTRDARDLVKPLDQKLVQIDGYRRLRNKNYLNQVEIMLEKVKEIIRLHKSLQKEINLNKLDKEINTEWNRHKTILGKFDKFRKKSSES